MGDGRNIADPLAGDGVDEPLQSGGSAVRSLRLLAHLAAQGRALSLADMAADLALPKPTLHRLCTRLLDAGFLARDVDERSYVVGPALRRLALDALNHDNLRGLRHQVLTDLVAQTGETCNLTTLDGASVLYLDRVEAQRPWRLTLSVGVHVPLHCTASGKLFLSLMTHERREAILGGLPLSAMTSQSIISADALRDECARIASDGFSMDREEFVIGLIAIAVPVCDAQGQVRAAIAVHGPTTHLSMARAQAMLPSLRLAAERMSGLL